MDLPRCGRLPISASLPVSGAPGEPGNRHLNAAASAPLPTPAPLSAARAVGRILRYLGRRPGWVALCVGLLLTHIFIELTLPQFLGHAITALGPRGAIATGQLALPSTVAWLVGLVTLRTAIGLVLGPLRNRTALETLGDVRCAVYDGVQRRPFAWHDNSQLGELISRAGTDVFRLQELVFVCLLFAIDVLAGLAGTLMFIFLISPLLGGLTLVAMVPTVGAMAFFAARLQPRWRKVHERHSAMSTVLQENIAGVRVVKAFAREAAEIRRFRERRDEFLRELHSTVNYWAARVPLAQFLFGLGLPLVMWAGGREVIAGRLELGQLATVVFYLLAVGGRIGVIGQITSILQNAGSAAQRVAELLPTPASPSPVSTPSLSVATALTGPLCFEHVSLVYDRTPSLRVESEAKDKPVAPTQRPAGSGHPALSDVSFTVEPGQTVGIVGPTGAGKSSLLALLPRFYEPTTGRITLGGHDLRTLDRAELRRALAIVFQETFLFSASVADNIAYGRPDALREEIIQAAKAAYADGFISELARGYDTVIGERGVSLSGGQRQRLALARAFLCQPRILLLDDATSAIDPGTERDIQAATAELRRGRTTFIVSQRAASVAQADLILVLDQGRIVERGRPAELLARKGLYAELFQASSANAALPPG